MPGPDGVCIDANVMWDFSRELPAREGETYDLVCVLVTVKGIVLDHVIKQEWIDACPRAVRERFEIWYADELIAGRIAFAELARPFLPRDAVQQIHGPLGLPKGHRDIRYIRCAHATDTKYVLSEDIDLYDPTRKNARGRARDEAMVERRGPLCLYLRERLGIVVGMRIHCRDDLSLPGRAARK